MFLTPLLYANAYSKIEFVFNVNEFIEEAVLRRIMLRIASVGSLLSI